MPLPKRRHSKTRRDLRRTHDILKMPSLTICPNCQAEILPHHVCPQCGYYKGRQVIIKKEKKEKKKA